MSNKNLILLSISFIKNSLFFFMIIIFSYNSIAGPPFNTDDPEPVKLKHWEYYISSMNLYQQNFYTGTLPHLEINYGAIENVQLHVVLPMNFNYYVPAKQMKYAYATTEFGIKYRFIKETNTHPQIGTFPIVEIPTISNPEFNNGEIQIYLPVWIQKSWDKLTTYGGAGYWYNTGANNKNYLFAGWEVQYDFTEILTLGGEVFYHSASTVDSKSLAAINVGGYINFSSKFHLLFSFGHSFAGENTFLSYTGIQWTI